LGSQYEEDEVNSLHEFMREEAEARENEDELEEEE